MPVPARRRSVSWSRFPWAAGRSARPGRIPASAPGRPTGPWRTRCGPRSRKHPPPSASGPHMPCRPATPPGSRKSHLPVSHPARRRSPLSSSGTLRTAPSAGPAPSLPEPPARPGYTPEWSAAAPRCSHRKASPGTATSADTRCRRRTEAPAFRQSVPFAGRRAPSPGQRYCMRSSPAEGSPPPSAR